MKKLTKEFMADIKSLVTEIESKSTGEIVPVILESSDSYPSAHFRWALLLSLVAPVLLYMAPLSIDDPIWFMASQSIAATLGLIIAFHPKLKRFMLTKNQMNEEVYQRALQAYFEHGVHTTKDRDGVLIFISNFEHRAHILADIGIAAKVDEQTWKAILNKALIDLKNRDLPKALTGMVRETGELLTRDFPRNSQENADIQQSELDDGVRTD
tara:strand:+ start:17690 stop:18325 length:636 start_codon:yes stop_codon:yes gene_type:complete